MKIPQDPTSVALVDGVAVAPGTPAVPVDSPGLLRGEGIFETFVVRDGVPSPFVDLHDARLANSARLCDFDLEGRGLRDDLPDFLPHVATGAWRVRFTVIRRLDGGVTRLWTAGPEPAPREEVTLLLSDFRSDPLDPIAAAKTVSRIGWQVAKRRAQEAGALDALLRTIDGDLSECTSANVFVVHGERLCTPGLDRGILGGVTRHTLLAACAEAGLPVEERSVDVTELTSADEVWISNAILGVVPVTAILGVRDGLPGASGTRLAAIREAYRGYLARAEARLI
jgi:branched-subunit amino acid aminotransferase/4-amino-4-deoxychorismate lyase